MKERTINALLTFLLCLFGNGGMGQSVDNTLSYHLNQLSTEQGLSQGNVFQILKTQDGFVWIATEDGLNRFDGYDFITYKHIMQDSTSISDNYIRNLIEDETGTLWVGTNQGGLCKYDNKTNTFESFKHNPNHKNSISDNTVLSLLEASDGRLWIGTALGLNIFDSESEQFNLITYSEGNGLLDNLVYSIVEDANHVIWVGTKEGISLYDLNGMFIRNYHHSEKTTLGKGAVTNMAVGPDSAVWISISQEGLYRFDAKSKKFSKFEHDSNDNGSIASYQIRSLFFDSNGVLWIGHDGFGFQQYDPDTQSFLNVFKNSVLPAHELMKIYEIYEDNEQNIWFGSYGHGIYVYNANASNFEKFQYSYLNNSLSHNSVLALSEGDSSEIWIGTDGGGLDCYHQPSKQFINYSHDENKEGSLSGNVVKSLLKDHENNLWVGTYNKGLNFRKKGQNYFEKFNSDNSPLQSNSIWAMLEDSKNNIWVGTLGAGLYKYRPKNNTWINYNTIFGDSTSLSGSDISFLMEDKRGYIWVGTIGSGISILDPVTDKFSRIANDEHDINSLSHNAVRYIYEGYEGIIWVGTTLGLNKIDFQDNKFTRYYSKDGLPSDVIKDIAQDKEGNLWLGTNNGICLFDPKTEEVIKFTQSDGLQGKEYNYNASITTREGKIYIGGINGFNAFYPNKVKRSTNDPSILLTKFLMFNQEVAISNSSPLKMEINQIGEIVFEPEDFVFSIEFSIDEFHFPKENLFQYKLDGFSEDWSSPSKNRSATYTHLPVGEYTLLVRATNNSGKWSKNVRKIQILVLPPWWQTNVVRFIFLLFFILIVFGMIRLRTSYLHEQRNILKDLVQKRTKELHEKNERITAQAEELHAFNDALNHLIENLEKTVEDRTTELVSKNKVLSDYAFLNAHNLRAPVANIKGLVHIFDFDISIEEKNDIIKNIKGQVEKVDDVLLEINERLRIDDLEKIKLNEEKEKLAK